MWHDSPDIYKFAYQHSTDFNHRQFHLELISIMAFKKLLKVVYDYEAAADDELTLNEGDFIGVLGDEDEDGWYYGSNLLKDAETSGFIPASYCEEVKIEIH